jgi:glycosyltransferase
VKISIITATYNCEKTIEDAIKSVSEQDFPNIEHIIIDGASTDKTLEVINQNSDRISILISEPDKGIYDALNKGISKATGDYIGFLHADDIYNSKTVISEIVEILNKENSDSLYADLQYVSKNNTAKIIRYWKSGIFEINKLKNGWMPPHPTFFVKKEIYERFGFFDTNFKISADYDIILRFLGKHKISTSYFPKTIIKMRVGGESNRSFKNIKLKMEEDLKALKKNNIGSIISLLLKNISKIPQLFSRNN